MLPLISYSISFRLLRFCSRSNSLSRQSFPINSNWIHSYTPLCMQTVSATCTYMYAFLSLIAAHSHSVHINCATRLIPKRWCKYDKCIWWHFLSQFLFIFREALFNPLTGSLFWKKNWQNIKTQETAVLWVVMCRSCWNLNRMRQWKFVCFEVMPFLHHLLAHFIQISATSQH